MRAAVLHAFGEAPTVHEVRVAPIGAREVRIRTSATGICHSDRFGQTGGNPALALPTVLGHEAAGVVAEVGDQVSAVRPGDHVVVTPAGSCGMCTWCSAGQPQHCSDLARVRPPGEPSRLTLDGAPLGQYVGIGAFAEELLVPGSSVAVVPKDLPLDRAALLGCAITTGLGAIRHSAQVALGQTVAVIGCGGVGLSAIQGAVIAGASRIIAVDKVPERLALARALGATDTVEADAADPVEAVRDLTSGGVDHAIEMIGLPATIGQAFAMLRTRGTATVVGLSRPGDVLQLPATDLLAEKRLQGSRLGGTSLRIDIPLYAQLYLAGRLDLDALVGPSVPLEGLGTALEEIHHAIAARTLVTF